MSLRWGILSTAWISERIAGSNSSQEITAVASRDIGRAAAFAKEHGIPGVYGSYEELLAAPNIDVIYNPLPNSMHVDWTIKALEAGKHVLCEKPFSRHPAEVERAVAVAQDRSLVLAEAFMWRHHPQVARTRELMAAGEIGEVRVLRSGFSFFADDPDDIRLDPALDGGALMDTGTYCVNAFRLLAGAEPERVYAEAAQGGKGVDVGVVATLRFPGDVLGRFDCGIASNGGDSLEVVGTTGSLYLEDPWVGDDATIQHRSGFLGRDVRFIETPGNHNPYANELDDFERAVRGEGPSANELGRDMVAQARVLAALYASIDSGAPERVG